MQKFIISAAVVLLTALGACGPLTSERLAGAQALKPSGNAFQTALWKGYIQKVSSTEYASAELAEEMDLSAAELFIDKAIMAANGQTPAPEDPSKHRFSDPAAANDLRSALTRMNTAFSATGTQKAPERAAEAQVAYDCWVHEAEEGLEPTEIKECRDKFMAAMDAVEAALKPVAAAPAPVPAPMKMPGPYVVYFEWNKSNLDKAAMDVINQVVGDVRTGKPSVINVAGHTDTSGSPAYNLKLSQKRADVVATALKNAGVTVLVVTSWVGEDDLAIPTGPNVREAKNRRTVIVFGK
jgi:OOP family OmpA-OmpF porin